MAEAFAPGSDDAVMIFGEKEPALLTKIHVCSDCFHFKPLGEILEKAQTAAESTSTSEDVRK